ncbi:hypothetical protein KY342_04590 [Candidatus Woesearchaeota archaeon]|nr:hypothetical protein [Candidatus Woesearchaeota archaeon]
MHLLKSRKAISPLLATILLVVLATSLGVIAMSWGRAQLEDASYCPITIGLKIIELNQQPQICHAGSGENGVITFIVENGPNVDVSSLNFRVIGSKDVYTVELIRSSIKKGYPLLKNVPYNYDLFGDIRQIKITPRIVLFPGENPILCPKQALIVEDIKECK